MTKDTPMRRIVASAVLPGFMTVSTACYGPFNLTRNVYHCNSGVKGSGEVSDKWMKELVFFGMIVVPVYMFSALLDAFIFNSIQFWSGDNPDKVTQDEEGRIREVQLGKITARVKWAEDRGGKTCFGVDWLNREIKESGAGDYIVVTATFPLLELKLLPEFRMVFETMMKLGTYSESKKIFTYHDGKTRIIFGSATNPESIESATAKAAWLDEAGQKQFHRDTWEAVQRRLSLHRRARTLYHNSLRDGMVQDRDL